jgi:hypothetical protein
VTETYSVSGQGADISLSGGQLRLRGFDRVYDFNGDTTVEPAKLNLVPER